MANTYILALDETICMYNFTSANKSPHRISEFMYLFLKHRDPKITVFITVCT